MPAGGYRTVLRSRSTTTRSTIVAGGTQSESDRRILARASRGRGQSEGVRPEAYSYSLVAGGRVSQIAGSRERDTPIEHTGTLCRRSGGRSVEIRHHEQQVAIAQQHKL